MRKTMWLSEIKETDQDKYTEPMPDYNAQYIFHDGKWRQDTMYFDTPEQAREYAKRNRYVIK